MSRHSAIIIFILLVGIFGLVAFFLTSRDSKQNNFIQPPINTKDLPNFVDTIKVMAAGDIACGGNFELVQQCAQDQTARLILNENPDLVLTLGDTQYNNGQYEYFQQFFDKSWGQFKDKIRPAIGNHEYGTPNAKGYFDYFNGLNNHAGPAGERDKGYFSFDQGNWHFIALNSNCGIVGCNKNSNQYQWLQEDLTKNTKKCILAYWHHPLYSSGHYENNPAVASFWDASYQNNVEIILNGHDHIYERFAPQDPLGNPDNTKGIQQFIVGTGGRNLYSIRRISPNSEVRYNQKFGVLKLILDQEKYHWEFINIDNEIIDQGSASCH